MFGVWANCNDVRRRRRNNNGSPHSLSPSSSWRFVILVASLLLLVAFVEGSSSTTTQQQGSSSSSGRRKNDIGGGGGIKGRRHCVSYGDNLGESVIPELMSYVDMGEEEEDTADGVTEMVCAKDSQFCYALWQYSANGTKEMMKQGCWEASSNTPSCLNQCVARVPKGRKGGPSVVATNNINKEQDAGAAATSAGLHTQETTTPAGGGATEDQHHQPQKPNPFFCCCDKDNCNLDVDVIYVDPEEGAPKSGEDAEGNLLGGAKSFLIGGGANKNFAIGLVILCASVISGVMILGSGYRYWRRVSRRRQRKDGTGANGENGDDGDGDVHGLAGEGKLLLLGIGGGGECESLLGENAGGLVDGIQLVVLLARGKFASVYEGRIPSLSDGPFALKCFSKDQKEFFENERFVFNYLGKHCNHENIIKYHGWQEFTVGPTTHLILVLDKICPGSLREYLQSVTMQATNEDENRDNQQEQVAGFKVGDVLRICSGIAAGLSYLHGENRDEIVIAHRDLTSKNILVDSSTLTPKITDYGLSLVTSGSKYYWAGRERQAEFCSLAEAGTLRYMAPELLEGAVNLKDCENALKQADVYALALILWEVANCSADMRLTQVVPPQAQSRSLTQEQVGPTPPQPVVIQHSLPYEDEIGKDNLTMDALSRHVVQYRQRPHFRRWRDSPYTRQLRDTLIESWDAEPDARLTALCIVERLVDIRNIRVKNTDLSNKTSVLSGGLQALQSPLESPTSGLFGADGTGPVIIDSPWTGRNPCLQRNLLVNTTTSTSSGGTEGLSTSGSMLSDGTGGVGMDTNHHNHHHLPTHPLLLNHFDLAKNQANLNFYHNYVGGSSGGTSYTGSTSGGGAGNLTEVSNVSSVTDDRHGGSIATGGTTRCPTASIAPTTHPLPPTIPFVQNLHN